MTQAEAQDRNPNQARAAGAAARRSGRGADALDLRSVGLVIQGPLVSSGKTARNRDIPLEQLPPEEIVTFDCTDSIARMIELAKDRLGGAVCVTWDTEDASRLIDLVGQEHVLQIRDTTPTLKARSATVPGLNKYKQFTCLLAGLNALKDKGLRYALKVRSDQELQVVEMAQHLIRLDRAGELEGRILIPAFKLSMTFGVEDFYMGGRYDALRRACQVYLGFGPRDFCMSVHCDFFSKVSFDSFGRELPVPLGAYFLKDGWSAATPDQCAIAARAWRSLFATFPRSIWESAHWRGEPMSPYEGNRFSEDDGWLSDLTDRLDVWAAGEGRRVAGQVLIATDWERLGRFTLGASGATAGRALDALSRQLRASAEAGRKLRSLAGRVLAGARKPGR